MDRLWAPWRSKYILGFAKEDKPRTGGCIFCDLPAQGADAYRKNLIYAVGQRALIIANRFPYNSGHIMVVPTQHVDDPAALDAADYRVLTEVLRRASIALRQVLKPDGLNVGMNIGKSAGAGIAAHCHYHLVPRWSGDTNFMPVIGEARVLSVSLEENYDQLYPALRGLVAEVEAELVEAEEGKK